MARARFIRPEFFTDEKLSDLPFGACMLFAGIWCHADLRGVFEHSPRQLRGLIFSMRDGIDTATVEQWLSALESAGSILRFEARAKTWGHVVNWSRYQSATHREVEIWTKRPVPPGWADPPGWDAAISAGIKAGRIRVDPRTVLEPTPEQFQNSTLTPTPTLTPASASSNARAREPQPPDPLGDSMRDIEQAHQRATKTSITPLPQDDWFYWRQTHPRLFIARSDEDGNQSQWQGLYRKYGKTILNAMYEHVIAGLPGRNGIGYKQALLWLTENTVETADGR